jgi:hypothetical protein
VRKQFTPIPLRIGEKRVRGGFCALGVNGFQGFCEHAHADELTQRWRQLPPKNLPVLASLR